MKIIAKTSGRIHTLDTHGSRIKQRRMVVHPDRQNTDRPGQGLHPWLVRPAPPGLQRHR